MTQPQADQSWSEPPAESGDHADDDRRTGYLELFFDLVYVYAITQVTTLLGADLSAAGFLRSGLVLALIWWAWSINTWAANAVSLRRAGPQVAVLLAGGGAFFVAQAIPDAFAGGGAWFATAYLGVRLLVLAFYWFGLSAEEDHRAALLTFAPGAALSPIVVLVGGFVDQPARQWIWSAALAIDLAAALNAGRGAFHINAAHFAERYALIIIVALGEAVVAIGLATGTVERDAGFFFAVVATLALAGLLWWGYFGWVAEAAEAGLRSRSVHARGVIARDLYTFFHFPMVAGIVVVAVAAKKVVAHPGEPLPDGALVALGLGLALFLSGFVAGRLRAQGTWAVERLAAIVGIVAICLVLRDAPAIAVVVACGAILGLALVVEWRRKG